MWIKQFLVWRGILSNNATPTSTVSGSTNSRLEVYWADVSQKWDGHPRLKAKRPKHQKTTSLTDTVPRFTNCDLDRTSCYPRGTTRNYISSYYCANVRRENRNDCEVFVALTWRWDILVNRYDLMCCCLSIASIFVLLFLQSRTILLLRETRTSCRKQVMLELIHSSGQLEWIFSHPFIVSTILWLPVSSKHSRWCKTLSQIFCHHLVKVISSWIQDFRGEAIQTRSLTLGPQVQPPFWILLPKCSQYSFLLSLWRIGLTWRTTWKFALASTLAFSRIETKSLKQYPRTTDNFCLKDQVTLTSSGSHAR